MSNAVQWAHIFLIDWLRLWLFDNILFFNYILFHWFLSFDEFLFSWNVYFWFLRVYFLLNLNFLSFAAWIGWFLKFFLIFSRILEVVIIWWFLIGFYFLYVIHFDSTVCVKNFLFLFERWYLFLFKANHFFFIAKNIFSRASNFFFLNNYGVIKNLTIWKDALREKVVLVLVWGLWKIIHVWRLDEKLFWEWKFHVLR